MFINTKDGVKNTYFEVCDKEFKNLYIHSRPVLVKSPILEKYMKELKTAQTTTKYITSDISELDKSLGGGFSPGLFIFGANPGLGKTSLMLHLINNFASKERCVLLFNLEMSTFQIMTKLLANYSYRKSLQDSKFRPFTINELSSYNIDLRKEVYDLMTQFNESAYRFINVISKSEDLNTHPNNQSDYVECIETALMNYRDLIKVTPIVIVDFLQLLKSEPSEEGIAIDRRLEMNVIIEKLKKYSNVYQATIIVISSLSRRSYTNETVNVENIDYNLSAFKESGMIEYQADFLAVLTKGKKIVNFGGKDKSQINISVLKTRYSPYSDRTFSLAFTPDYSYFEELEERK